MGVNNRARRAAKKRKSSTGRPGAPSHGGSQGSGGFTGSSGFGGFGPQDDDLAELLVAEVMDLCRADEAIAGDLADALLDGTRRLSVEQVGAAMQRRLRQSTQGAIGRGWGPRDLSELVRRHLAADHQSLLAEVLTQETARHKDDRVAAQWRDEVAAIGPLRHPPLHVSRGLVLALTLAAVLERTPRIPQLMPPPGQADPLDAVRVEPGGQDAKVLAKVRALLAKAESTEYAEEAEALSSKAQELITRYSLDRLIAAADRTGHDATTIIARRFWIDAPYVGAKALLVFEVARANRCSTVSAEKLGFSTIAGTSSDIDAVEVLTTSLMVQADMAILAAGRRSGTGGEARSASYRRSFLLAYARRIGERLTEADAATASTVMAESQIGRGGDGGGGGMSGGGLVPVLKEHGERVDAALHEMFPHVVYKRTSIGNWKGWVEGQAAANQARLDGTRSLGR